MISNFKKGNKKVVKKLNSLVHNRNKQERVKSSQAASLPYRYNQRIYFGEVVTSGEGSFTGTFYDYEGTLLTSASTSFYQQTINGSGEEGEIFCAIKYNGGWYSLTGGGSGGVGSFTYAIITQQLSYENNDDIDSYTVVLLTEYEADPSNATEYTISKAYNYKSSTIDLRNYVPWFQVDDIVRVKYDATADEYFLDETIFFVGNELGCSLRWSEEEGRLRAVVV